MHSKTISQKEALVAAQHRKEGDYWTEKLAGDFPRSQFPTDFKSPPGVQNRFDSVPFRFTAPVVSRLNQVTDGRDDRLHIFLAAGLTGLLYKYTHHLDIVIGTPIYKQSVRGEFINTVLPLRIHLDPGKTFKEIVLQLRSTLAQAVIHQNYPLDALLRRLDIPLPSGGGDFPLFDAAVLLDNIHDREYIRNIHVNTVFRFLKTDGAIQGQLEYNTRLYKKETAERIVNHFQALIRGVIFQLNTPLPDFPILSEDEIRQLLYDFNSTVTGYPRDKTIPDLFFRQVVKKPDNIAVAWGASDRMPLQLTYAELDRQSTRFARFLQNNGVAPGHIVGVKIRRSVDMIIGILGILKARAAYMPIRLDFPQTRIDYMMADSCARILVTAEVIEKGLHDPGIQDPPESRFPLDASGLAYVIYTSGTTGNPKGVLTSHSNVIRVVRNTNYIDITPADRVLQLSSYAFDGSVLDIYGAFLNGAALVLVGEEQAAATDRLARLICTEQATVFFIAASLFNALVNVQIECFTDVRKIYVGGERLSVEHCRRALDYLGAGKLTNLYGPTETTVSATYYNIDTIASDSRSIPIGKPVSNTSVYILDAYLNPVPVGVSGEVYIGGDGTARGYLNSPQLTRDKFYPVPPRFSQSPLDRWGAGNLYRTGDLARWLPDGNIDFINRIDHQVKLRGFRLELGEIETQLLKHRDIKEAVVILKEEEKESSLRYLCAYIVAGTETALTSSGLREYLSRHLPDYMIPSYFVMLQKLPITPNGKLDRRALPDPEISPEEDFAAPVTPVEEKLAAVWSGVLGIEKESISIDSNFFNLGGHSLKATILVARIHKELDVKVPIEDIFVNPTIRRLAVFIGRLSREKYLSIRPAEQREYYPLSSAQKRLYVLQQMETGLTFYNIPAALLMEGQIDRERMGSVFRELIRRHESFRTCFPMIGHTPVQKILRHVDFDIQSLVLDHSGPGEQGRKSVRLERVMGELIKPFDLACAPLVRVCLVKIEEEKHLLLVDMHHIITDGTSMGVLIREFMTLYSGESLSPLPIQYKDYAQWLYAPAVSEAIKKQEEYWLNRFRGEIPKLQLPLDFPRPAVQSFEGSYYKFQLDQENSRALNDLSSRRGATLYIAVLALFNVLLSKLSGSEDMIVGTPVALRRHADLQDVIGMFVNTLAMRNYPTGEKTFDSFMAEVKDNTIEAFENQEYQFEDLVEKVAVSRETNRNPLFDVMFTFQNIDIPRIEIPGLILSQYEHQYQVSKFDIIFYMFEISGGLLFSFEYCTKLFHRDTIVRFSKYFKRLVSSVLERPETEISRLDIISPREREQILHDFNDTRNPYPDHKTIAQVFEDQVEETPDAIAVHWLDEALTYKELNTRANALAGLLQRNGLKRRAPVIISAEVSIQRIAAVLGILKTGSAYVPLNIDDPPARKDYILKDINADIVITDCPGTGFTVPTLIRLDQIEFHRPGCLAADSPGHWSDPAYIMYTSGSTGYAKGVVVEQRNVVRLVKNTGFIRFLPGDRMLQTGVLEFDASTFEIWGALLNGLTLFLVDKKEMLTPGKLRDHVEKHRLTVMWMTAPLFNRIVREDAGAFARIRQLVIGGDILSPAHVNRVKERFPQLAVVNGYGPTENTTFSTTFPIDRRFDHAIPIGKPISNSTAYIVDKCGRLVPPGIWGELVVGGHGVAKGYLNRPELTAEKFTGDPWGGDQRLYKTGDLCRWLPDGNIEISGRRDLQVKIRGFRIEPGEIENRLQQHDAVSHAVVTAHVEHAGDKFLCAYVVYEPVASETPGYRELKDFLSLSLPGHMIPAYIVPLKKIPLTSNGKIDRRALPVPGPGGNMDGAGFTPPRNEVEEQVAAIWSDVLGIDIDRIGIDTDFFELGGHSLKATTLAAKIHKTFDVKIHLVEIFREPTVRGLARNIGQMAKSNFISIEPAEKKEYYQLSSPQKRMYGIHQMAPESTVYNMPKIDVFEDGLDEIRLEIAFERLLRRHESLVTYFELVKGEPVQRICPRARLEIEYLDTRTPGEIDAHIQKFVRPFDLSKAPLMRAGVIKKENRQECILMVDMHHIISDGFSLSILVRDFLRLYNGEEPPPLTIQYRDYSEWQNSREVRKMINEQEKYWLKQLEGELPVLDLAADYPDPGPGSFEGDVVVFEIDSVKTAALKRTALDNGATLYMILLAVYYIMLSKLTGQEDIIVGSGSAGRTHADLDRVIGMFVNTFALRNRPSGGKTFREFLREVKKSTLQAFENQEYKFENVMEKVVASKKKPGPLFDVVFALQNIDESPGPAPGEETAGGYHSAKYEFEKSTAKFDLTLNGFEHHDILVLGFEYRTKLFSKERIQRYTKYYIEIVASIIEDIDTVLNDINVSHNLYDRKLENPTADFEF